MSHGTATSFDAGFCCGLRLGHGDARSGEGEHGEQYIRDARGSVGYWRSYCRGRLRCVRRLSRGFRSVLVVRRGLVHRRATFRIIDRSPCDRVHLSDWARLPIFDRHEIESAYRHSFRKSIYRYFVVRRMQFSENGVQMWGAQQNTPLAQWLFHWERGVVLIRKQ
jgi:hypothetical protein